MRFDVPGAAIAIVQNDQVVMLEGFGVKERGSDDPITPQTRMMIAPHLAIFPGLAISLAVFGFNLLGDSLRDALDPRLRTQ